MSPDYVPPVAVQQQLEPRKEERALLYLLESVASALSRSNQAWCFESLQLEGGIPLIPKQVDEPYQALTTMRTETALGRLITTTTNGVLCVRTLAANQLRQSPMDNIVRTFQVHGDGEELTSQLLLAFPQEAAVTISSCSMVNKRFDFSIAHNTTVRGLLQLLAAECNLSSSAAIRATPEGKKRWNVELSLVAGARGPQPGIK